VLLSEEEEEEEESDDVELVLSAAFLLSEFSFASRWRRLVP
jgi:hypothetical protein